MTGVEIIRPDGSLAQVGQKLTTVAALTAAFRQVGSRHADGMPRAPHINRALSHDGIR